MALLAVLPLDLLQRVLESDALAHKDIASFARASPGTRDVVRACPTLFADVVICSDGAHRFLLSALGAGEVRSLTFKGLENRHTIDALLDVAHMHPERVRHMTRIKFDTRGAWLAPFFAARAMFPSLREIKMNGPIMWSQQMEFMMDARVTVESVIFTSSKLAQLPPTQRRFGNCNLQIDSAVDLCAAVRQGTRTRALDLSSIDRDVIISDDTAACIADMVEEELNIRPEYADYGNIIKACARRDMCSIYRITAHSNANVAALTALATGRRLATLHVTFTHIIINDLTPLSAILRDRVTHFAASMFIIGPNMPEQAAHMAHAFAMAAPMRIEELTLVMPTIACDIVLPRLVAPALKKLTLKTEHVVERAPPAEVVGQSIAALPALEELDLYAFGQTKWVRGIVDALLRAIPAGHPLRRVKTPRMCLMDNSDTLDVAAFRARPVTIAYPDDALQ